MRSVGIDLGKTKYSLAIVTNGQVTKRATTNSLDKFEKLLGPNTPKAQIAIEASRGSLHAYDVLTSWGHEVLMVDTTRARQLGIGQHKKKTDRIDAELLARAVEEKRVPTAHVLSERSRCLRELLIVRSELVDARRRFVTQLRGLLEGRGHIVPKCDAKDFAMVLDGAELPSDVAELIKPVAQMLAPVEEQIATVEQKLHEFVDDDVCRLTTIPGVGLIVALTYVSVIDDPKRFSNASKVAAYIGLVPSENSSGGKRRLGGITKQGNSYLRQVLVQGAWSLIRKKPKDDPFSFWAKDCAQRRGKRIAVIGAARKIARLMYSVWKHGTVYEPERWAQHSAQGLEQNACLAELAAKHRRKAANKLESQKRASARRAQKARELIQRGGPVMAS